MEIVLALLIGGAFGAVLDRIGASNPNLIGRMLNLTNLHLMKTILLAIGTGSVLLSRLVNVRPSFSAAIRASS